MVMRISNGESLVGVYRHPVGELHPTSVLYMKTQYLESLIVESTCCHKPLLKSSELLLLLLRHDETHGGGADDRVER
jgi:hypothetical protein